MYSVFQYSMMFGACRRCFNVHWIHEPHSEPPGGKQLKQRGTQNRETETIEYLALSWSRFPALPVQSVMYQPTKALMWLQDL